MCSSLPPTVPPPSVPVSSVINDRIPQKLQAVTSGGDRADSPPCRRLPGSALPWGGVCLSLRSSSETGESYTHTHRKRLRSLLNDEALDDVSEDLGLDDGLWRFVLPVLRRAARHSRRFALVSWGHGRRWAFWRSAGPLGWSPSWAVKADNESGWTQRCKDRLNVNYFKS